MLEIEKIRGIGGFVEKTDELEEKTTVRQDKLSKISLEYGLQDSKKKRKLYFRGEKVFLVINSSTLEVRTDTKLAEHLIQKYESVMWSRYFGKGGIEIVIAGEQLTKVELEDLIRLSYNLSE